MNQQGSAEAMASGDFPQACSGLCDVSSRQSIDSALADWRKTQAVNLEAVFMGTRAAVKTMGEPIDIANGCLFLASDEAKYMTGSELVIDRGYTCHWATMSTIT